MIENINEHWVEIKNSNYLIISMSTGKSFATESFISSKFLPHWKKGKGHGKERKKIDWTCKLLIDFTSSTLLRDKSTFF